jgi:hypothetical protein
MRPIYRKARLERVIFMMERDLDAKLPAMLVALLLRARRGVTTTNSELQAARKRLLQLLQPHTEQVG